MLAMQRQRDLEESIKARADRYGQIAGALVDEL